MRRLTAKIIKNSNFEGTAKVAFRRPWSSQTSKYTHIHDADDDGNKGTKPESHPTEEISDTLILTHVI